MESMNNVDKTLIHISHLHPLQLVASLEPKPICHACKMPCAEQSYGCIQCNYFLHITCATIRRSMDHPSHPEHTLKLELTSPYQHGQYRCDGCGVDGSSFCLRCRECGYDLHLHCAAITHKVNHRSHPHPLILVYNNPYPPNTEAFCDLCKNNFDVNKWFYLCKSCDYGGHVECLSPERLEVLSPGLQASQAPPQPHDAAQLQRQLQEQIIANTIMSDARRAAIDLIDGTVRYERLLVFVRKIENDDLNICYCKSDY